jgi:pyruvate formate lyase activating enzyme
MDKYKPKTPGTLHSIQSLGALDGPGLRTVVSLQGCQFRCKFCHSIDTTLMDRGEGISVEELLKRILKNQQYWRNYKSNQNHDGGLSLADTNEIIGGVTITGGDPAVQPEFTKQLMIGLKQEGIHVAVESPLLVDQKIIDMWLPYVDLWMVSLKHMDNDKQIELTGLGNKKIHENIKYLDGEITSHPTKESKIRIRYVVIPDLHDDEVHLKQLSRFVANIKNLEEFEFIPYTSMGAYKWKEIFGKYDLEDVRDADENDVDRARAIYNQILKETS